MRPRSSYIAAALPGAAALTLWGGYRRAVNEFLAREAVPGRLRGSVRVLPTDWGHLSYRYVAGSIPADPLVLIHGWGRSADSVWWKFIQHTRRTVIALDLPGHGRSRLEGPFTFSLAAESIRLATADAGVTRPILVTHSMGGPVALTAIRDRPFGDFGGLVAVATSAFWIRPSLQFTVAAAPFLFSPTSPIVTGAMRAEIRRDPVQALEVERRYAMRPTRRVLIEAAAELRRFDARKWTDLAVPMAVWVVTTGDGVIRPSVQRQSANCLGIQSVDVDADHRAPTELPHVLDKIIEAHFESQAAELRLQRL